MTVGGRKGVEAKRVAHAGIGGIGGRPLQVGGVLNGQQPFVEVGGIGIFLAGADFGAAFGGLLRHIDGAQALARGHKGRRVGIGPALELERGQVRDVLHGGDNDVGAGQKRAEVIRAGDAHLKFLMQFHGLAGKGEFGGLARLVHAMLQGVQVRLLVPGERPEFALRVFLAGEVAGDFSERGAGIGDVIGGQA